MNKQRYNTVLMPPDDYAVELTAFAQANLSTLHNGYCLAPGTVLPHITLAQAYIESGQLERYMESLVGIADIPARINITDYFVMPESMDSENAWVWLLCCKQEDLLKVHRDVLQLLKGCECEIKGKVGEDYLPHITLGRVDPARRDLAKMLDAAHLVNRKITGWRLAFGLSDEAGQLLKVLRELSCR